MRTGDGGGGGVEMKPEIYWVSFVERQNQEKLLPCFVPPLPLPHPHFSFYQGGET